MELFSEIMQPLMTFIAITFLITEVVKQILQRVAGIQPDKWVIIVAIVVGILLSYGWTLSVLPEPKQPGFGHVATILTGLIIAGAASGLFTWLRNIFPWFDRMN